MFYIQYAEPDRSLRVQHEKKINSAICFVRKHHDVNHQTFVAIIGSDIHCGLFAYTDSRRVLDLNWKRISTNWRLKDV